MVWPDDDQRDGRSDRPDPTGRDAGYGGTNGYAGSERHPALPPPPPVRLPYGARAAIVTLIVLVLGGGVSATLMASRTHERHPSPIAASSAPASGRPPVPSHVPSAPPSARAKVPGWHAVVSVQHGLTYDVPPSTWSVKPADTIVGFEDPHGRVQVAGSGAAVYKEGYCPGHSGSWRAQAAVTGYDSKTDPSGDAEDAARGWATNGYTPDTGGSPPTVTLGGPTPLDADGTPAMEVTATVTVHDDASCSPPRAVVHAVAVPAANGEVSVLVVMADQGVPDAILDSELKKIAASARPTE